MTNRFSHIYRFSVIGLLMAGFLAHLVLPLSGQAKKTSFTRWLSHNVVDTGNENELRVRDSIRKLPVQGGDFSVLLREASELIANHREVFRISTQDNTGDSHQLTSWLVSQWNVYQHQKSSTDAALTESSQIYTKWLNSNQAMSSFTGGKKLIPDIGIRLSGLLLLQNFSTPVPAPLAFGISINAP